jgi:hypothetical protein
MAFDPVTFGIGAGTALLSPVVDLFTGASANRNRAYNDYQNALGGEINRVNEEAGPSASQSLAYKTSVGILDPQYRKRQRTNRARAAAEGLTPEAQTGATQGLNESYNTALLGALGNAMQRRDALREQSRQLTMQKYGIDVNRANQTLANQGQWAQSVSALMPYLLRDPNKTMGEGQ